MDTLQFNDVWESSGFSALDEADQGMPWHRLDDCALSDDGDVGASDLALFDAFDGFDSFCDDKVSNSDDSFHAICENAFSDPIDSLDVPAYDTSRPRISDADPVMIYTNSAPQRPEHSKAESETTSATDYNAAQFLLNATPHAGSSSLHRNSAGLSPGSSAHAHSTNLDAVSTRTDAPTRLQTPMSTTWAYSHLQPVPGSCAPIRTSSPGAMNPAPPGFTFAKGQTMMRQMPVWMPPCAQHPKGRVVMMPVQFMVPANSACAASMPPATSGATQLSQTVAVDGSEKLSNLTGSKRAATDSADLTPASKLVVRESHPSQSASHAYTPWPCMQPVTAPNMANAGAGEHSRASMPRVVYMMPNGMQSKPMRRGPGNGGEGCGTLPPFSSLPPLTSPTKQGSSA